ncbi:RNA exonuclease 4 [Bombina bombina]|uniref:RNA exonuclease 4 n=1 Tax=Bombina bombina TaxID=8345 RepID=UPI00235B11BA|nr:RNA exonuclease 4 [Bombina bombina]
MAKAKLKEKKDSSRTDSIKDKNQVKLNHKEKRKKFWKKHPKKSIGLQVKKKVSVLPPPKEPQEFSSNWKTLQELLKSNTSKPAPNAAPVIKKEPNKELKHKHKKCEEPDCKKSDIKANGDVKPLAVVEGKTIRKNEKKTSETTTKKTPEMTKKKTPEMTKKKTPEMTKKKTPEMTKKKTPEITTKRTAETTTKRTAETTTKRTAETTTKRTAETTTKRTAETTTKRTAETTTQKAAEMTTKKKQKMLEQTGKYQNKHAKLDNCTETPKVDIWFDDVDPDDIEAAMGPEAGQIARKMQGLPEKQSSSTDVVLVKEKAFEGLTKTVAMDCEMVGVGQTGEESILARVSIVNQFGKCVYDKYVKQTEWVTDFRTAVSGIRPDDMKNGEQFKVVQKEVSEILRGRTLVGHAVHNDLKILFLDHPKKAIRDTQKYKPFKQRVKSGRPSLKLLCEKILNVKVQKGEHCSIQDAQAAMRLYTMEKKEWEKAIKAKYNKKPIAQQDNPAPSQNSAPKAAPL